MEFECETIALELFHVITLCDVTNSYKIIC